MTTPSQRPVPAQPSFENLRRTDRQGGDYWFARDLAPLLEYQDWRNFVQVVERAKLACAQSGHRPPDHFGDVTRLVDIGSGAQREVRDFRLSRYACYLIVQNGDPAKPVIAQGQILDHMGSTELAANLFRATQTEDKLRREWVRGKTRANQTHQAVGAKVRQTIAELGGEMPENLPVPQTSIPQIEAAKRKLEPKK